MSTLSTQIKNVGPSAPRSVRSVPEHRFSLSGSKSVETKRNRLVGRYTRKPSDNKMYNTKTKNVPARMVSESRKIVS